MTGVGTSEKRSLSRLGPYELVRPVAHGGMAEIYLARRDGEHVALKVLSDRRATDPEACAMFLDEARIVTLLDHEHVARVRDVAVAADGTHYLAMEYVHGVDLRGLLSACAHANRKLAYEAAIAIVMAAATGLDHAHRRCDPAGRPLQLVHRDVSLSNIMVGHDGVVKVVDFGIASTTVGSVHTSPGVVRGKASYMSPEQCLGDRVDHRTDVFALGIVLYELTTGARCFAGKSDFDRMLAVVRGEYVPPRDLVADYPHELAQVLRCALATDASHRYPSAAALIDALGGVLAARGWTGGRAAIEATMRALFGDVAAPWTIAAAEPLPTQRFGAVASPTTVGRAALPQGTRRAIVDDAATPTRDDLPALQLHVEFLNPERRAAANEPTLRTTRVPRRLGRGTDPGELAPGPLARGSEPELRVGWAPAPRPDDAGEDDDDQLTRGRRCLKRPPSRSDVLA